MLKQYLLLIIAAMIAFMACNKSDMNPAKGEYQKKIIIDCGDLIITKSNDAAVNNVALFLFQKVGNGEPILWRKKNVTNTTEPIEFILAYSDQNDYSYYIEAFANMGDLTERPMMHDVKLINEKNNGLQMYARADIKESDEVIKICLDRFLSKVTVSSVEMKLPDPYWDSKITLKSMYFAKFFDTVENGQILNEDGYHTAYEYDKLIYKRYDIPFSFRQKENLTNQFYLYGPTANLILECELNGVPQFYNVEMKNLKRNMQYNLLITILREGANTPFGDAPEMSFLVVENIISVNEYNDETINKEF